MRPLRLLLSLSSSLLAVALLLYIALTPSQDEASEGATASQGSFTALFSFTSPGSLFPPSAIISLTDDNSTFFLARPAAFGPALSNSGLSGPLWIGSGFGDEALGQEGELGCGDLPGWDHDGHRQLHTSRSPPLGQPEPSRAALDDYSLLAAETTYDEPVRAPRHADIQLIQESAEIAGKVVLLKRGGCGFLAKVQWAQRRGGVAVIVGDDVRGGALVRMYAQGDTSDITIPSLFTSHTTAHLLSSLLPSERVIQNLALAEVASLESNRERGSVNRGDSKEATGSEAFPTSTRAFPQSTHASGVLQTDVLPPTKETRDKTEQQGALHSLISTLRLLGRHNQPPKAGSRRLPCSGNFAWLEVADEEDDQQSLKTWPATTSATITQSVDGFHIGEQDWRDPDLLSTPSSNVGMVTVTGPTLVSTEAVSHVLPGSGEYVHTTAAEPWWRKWLGANQVVSRSTFKAQIRSVTSITGANLGNVNTPSYETTPHEGLWVTLTPTNVSTSPFFDTLLVLVVSPLVTLTVVYVLLLLRSRIRRRRWRAPKSVVERLPVRTYQTISELSSSATPEATSPTTPLLQQSPTSSTSSVSQPRSRADSEVPTAPRVVQRGHRDREEEKLESGLAAWRRRYGGRQKECVVCLEEYEDGVSRVMSLPCGHEFHADCITPWLVTRRRTCPICKGDVVRSLSQSYHDHLRLPSSTRTSQPLDDGDALQTQLVEALDDSPSASLSVPISMSAPVDLSSLDDDLEMGTTGDETRQSRRSNPESGGHELSSSLRELSSTVSTVIWRGFDAFRSTSVLQGRSPMEDVDRDQEE